MIGHWSIEISDEIETKIGRLADELRQEGSSEEIHELEARIVILGAWAKCYRVVNIWIITPFRKLWENEKEQRNDPEEEEGKSKISRS